MSELTKEDDMIFLDANVYFSANHYISLPNDVSICRDSQYDNQDNIDIDITKEQAIKIVNLLQRHYKLESKE